jgi:hypothetical protein
MTAAIVVELPPADVPPLYAETLIDSCNIGMQQRATCVTGPGSEADAASLGVAIVSWKGSDQLEARIEVGLREPGAAQWQERAVVFSPADPEIERWRTLGFAIATLVKRAIEVGPEGSDEAPASGAPAAVIPEPALSASEATGAPRSSSTGFSANGQFIVESGVPWRAPALGAEIRFEQEIRKDQLFLTGAIACTDQFLGVDHIDLLRARASAGGGLVLLRLGDHVRVVARLAVAIELIQATGRDPLGGASDSGSRWAGGLEQGADVRWMWSRALGAAMGIEVREATGGTEILAHDTEVASVPALEWVGTAGLRLAFP